MKLSLKTYILNISDGIRRFELRYTWNVNLFEYSLKQKNQLSN